MKCLSHRLPHPMLLLLPFFLGYPAFAQEQKAHIHGSSTLLVALESDELVVELSAPADSIVGFEHTPKNEAQERQVDAALVVLKSPTQLFALPAVAGCAVEAVRVLASMHDDKHEDGHKEAKDDHPKAQDHAHNEKASVKAGDSHDDDGETHSEFRLRYYFHCQAIDKLAGLELLMFERFPRMHRVQVHVISAQGQKSVELDHDRRRLTF